MIIDLEANPFGMNGGINAGELAIFVVKPNDIKSKVPEVHILKQRPGPYEFALHPRFLFSETPEQRAKRELGFPIEGVEP